MKACLCYTCLRMDPSQNEVPCTQDYMEHSFVEHEKDFHTQGMKRQTGVETEHVCV